MQEVGIGEQGEPAVAEQQRGVADEVHIERVVVGCREVLRHGRAVLSVGVGRCAARLADG
ncbi:hypothetical protein [Streptomyces sp. NPDC005423]|uniref:hypothetical protein n=1 Tax=Streptomyces sp. NPDC005423 TaxID=3155343 RepID=UPI0033AC7378